MRYHTHRGSGSGCGGPGTGALTWSRDCDRGLPGSVLGPFVPQAAGAGQPLFHVAAVGAAVLHRRVLEEEPEHAGRRALQVQPPLQVVLGRLLPVVEGGLAAQAGHGLPLRVVGLPHEPLHHELGGRAGAVQDHALQLHLPRLQDRQVPLHLAELQAAVCKGEGERSAPESSKPPAPPLQAQVMGAFHTQKTAPSARGSVSQAWPPRVRVLDHVPECPSFTEFHVTMTAVPRL